MQRLVGVPPAVQPLHAGRHVRGLVPRLVEHLIRGHDPRHAEREARGHQHARGEPLTHHQVASGRIGFVACLIAIVAVGAGAEFATLARADTGFLLHAAGAVLDGARLYVDVVEINPPLIIALNLPAVLIARVTGVSDILVYRALVTVALLGALAFADWSLRWILRPPDDTLRRRLVLVLAFALFLAPGNDFGQREHLLVALALPYLVLAAGRVDGRPAPLWPALAAGVLAGIGLALKPQFLLVVLVVEGAVILRFHRKHPSPEALGAAAFLLGYLAVVAIVTPEYFSLVRLLGPVYAGFGRYPILSVLATAPGAALCFLAVLACLALRREAKHWGLWCVLLISLVAAFVAGAAQQKGWGYHFYPARVFALALLALAVLDVRRPLVRPVQQLYAAVAFAALGTSMVSALVTGIRGISRRDPARLAEQSRFDELASAVRRHVPVGGSLYAFSYSIEAGFPLVNYTGVRWASRFPHLWILEAVYQDRLRGPAPLRFHAAEAMGSAERYLNDAVHEDLVRYRPDVLIVLRHARDVAFNAHRRLDYLAYFSRDPRIAGVLRQYRLSEEIGEYRLYARVDSPDQPGLPPRAEPGRYDLARSSAARIGARALVGDREFLSGALLFLLFAFGAWGLERRRAQRDPPPSERQGPT